MPGKAIKKPDFSLIYPGVYRTAGLSRKSQLDRSGAGVQKIKPLVSTVESPDDLTIRISAPGFLREDFIVMVKDCRVSVYALHRRRLSDTTETHLPAEIACYLGCRLQLPKNVDPDFISAEYRDGILCLRFLRTYQPCDSKRHHVAVY